MPGVQVLTSTVSGPSLPPKPQSGQWFVSGLTERGVVGKPVLLNGMADYFLKLGNRVSYSPLYDAIKSFFDEGGDQCYVSRVVGPAASVGTATLNDRAASPVATMRIDANSPGSWAGNVSINVLDGYTTDTFRIQVVSGGTVVEDYNNLTSPSSAVSKINAASNYITATDLGSPTTAPANNPTVVSGTTLSAGDSDRASVTSAMLVAGLDVFGADLGVGAVSIPGQNSAVYDGIAAHCEANNRVGILAATQTASKSDLMSDANSESSSSVGIFAPWVLVSDGAGGSRAISPEGVVAAKRAQAALVGPWTVPAGVKGLMSSVLDLYQTFSDSDADDLDAAGVSMIRRIGNSIRLYGWRSLSKDQTNYFLLSVQDLLNQIVVQGKAAMENYVFAEVDSNGSLLTQINTDLVAVVQPIADAGGLYAMFDADGNQLDPGYKVDTGNSVNTPTTLQNNIVKAIVSVRPSPSAAMIQLSIVRAGFTATL